MRDLLFKEFLAKEEESFFSAMSKIGINKDDYKKFPQYASFFSMGKNPVNFGSISILDYKKNEDGEITHVLVKKINDPHVHSLKFNDRHPDGIENKNKKDEIKLIPIEDFQDLLSQGQQQQQLGMDMGGIQ